MTDLSDFKRIVYEPETRALRRRAEAAEAEVARLKVGVEHVICDSPGTPDSVKGYLRKLISEDGAA